MIEEIFYYATPHNLIDLLGQSVKLQRNARCRIRILGNTVIATELPDNPGMSITNAAASVAMQVAQYHEILLDELTWIEHYPEDSQEAERFDQVLFTCDDGLLTLERWKRISKNDAERLLGASLR